MYYHKNGDYYYETISDKVHNDFEKELAENEVKNKLMTDKMLRILLNCFIWFFKGIWFLVKCICKAAYALVSFAFVKFNEYSEKKKAEKAQQPEQPREETKQQQK
ncbi:hypothetical protein [Apilactobacillus zhangqiuensis]|uniref:hypothetical protein n=1 Tax=Apilactobacillus zhangqiuensis TaxID=2841031 RepID=UPI001C7D34DF|nr:hypothetical protein [Apilactobacillus zhangqiuensis]